MMFQYLIKLFVSAGDEVYVGVGDNTILECDEAKHQPVTSVEWFCRWEETFSFVVYFSVLSKSCKTFTGVVSSSAQTTE